MSTGQTQGDNFLDMSDDAVMAMSAPPATQTSTATTDDQGTAATGSAEGEGAGEGASETVTPATSTESATTTTGEDGAAANNDGGAAGASAESQGAAAGGDAATEGQGDGGSGDGGAATTADAGTQTQATTPATAAATTTAPTTTTTTAAPTVPSTDAEFLAAGKLLFRPFKANGKDFQVQSADEAVKLMQQGCNYTKKMQELQPVKRIITMLSNNQLLDEGKLAYLIDLDKKNPQAIQKLLADSQFDPLTADKEAAAGYKPGNHQVSDLEVQFGEVLDEVAASPAGAELITAVQSQWDQPSKQAVFQNPDLLRTINSHKAMGLYDVIHAEVERQRTLGTIPANVPYLQAYKAMGDMLHESGRLHPAQAKPAPAPTTGTPSAAPVETRVVAPTGTPVNNDRAKAAASTKPTTSAAPAQVNYLDLSDDEFEKKLAGRV